VVSHLPDGASWRASICVPLLVLATAGLAYGQGGAGQPSAEARLTGRIDESRLTTLKGTTHRLAQSRFDKGVASDTLRLDRMQLVLMRSAGQEADVETLLEGQQDAHSLDYHKWLTPEEFGRRFGVAESDVAVVVAWLKSHGFQVNSLGKGRTVIEFSGVAAQIKSAFHTEIHKYVIGGEEHWANASDQQIPEALAGVVAGVAALHDFKARPLAKVGGKVPATKRGEVAQPDVTYGSLYGIGPADFATIYNVNPLYQAGINGAGSTIGVIGVNWIQLTDIENFQNVFGLPLLTSVQIAVNGSPLDTWFSGDEDDAEGVLDVSWALGVAPGANIVFIVSPSSGLADALALSEQYAVDNNAADVLTESFSYCEADMTAAQVQQANSIREQAAAQGVTWMVASGDSGPYCEDSGLTAAEIGPRTPNGLASSPYVVAVGGTEFASATDTSEFWASTQNPATLSSVLSYLPEVVWNDFCLPSVCGSTYSYGGSSGGGASALFAKPPWQAGVAGIPADGMRDTPDVSLIASERYFPLLVCYEGSCSTSPPEFRVAGGTSVSTPAFAGMMALVIQKTGSRQGQANYVLYKLAAAEQYSQCIAYNPSSVTQFPASSCVFNDITTGTSAVPGEENYGAASAIYAAAAGYDLATGLGSLNAANLVDQWNSVARRATSTTLTATRTTFEHGSSVAIQVSVAPQNGSGTPTGDVALMNPSAPFSGVFPLRNGTASFTTSALPGGTYNLTASYSGDGTFAASTSGPVALTVSPEASVISGGFVASLDQPNIYYSGGPYGATGVTQRAHVAGVSGQGTPTGVVEFDASDASQGLNSIYDTAKINSAGDSNDHTANPLPVGVWYVYEKYQGDNSFLPSVSPLQLVRVTPGPTVISVTPNVGTVAAGEAVTLTATVEGQGEAAGSSLYPLGVVTFFANGQALPPSAVVSWSSAELTASLQAKLPVGVNTITATYSGDPNHLGSATERGAKMTVVNGPLACQVGEFTASPNPIRYYDQAGVTTLTVISTCDFDIRVGSPSGQLLTSGSANFPVGPIFTAATGAWVTDGMTFYLQAKGNTTPEGTLQTLTVGVLAGSAPCVVYGFSAAPSPIITTSPLGATTIGGYASCGFDIRVGSPGGTLFTGGNPDGNGGYSVAAATGNWVSNGMQFFMQTAGNTKGQGTLASFSVPVVSTSPLCEVSQFSVSPMRILLTPGEAPIAYLTVAAGCAFDVRYGSPGGSVVVSGSGYWNDEVQPFTVGPTAYYLQVSGDTTPAGTLAKVVVVVDPVTHSVPPPGGGRR
jgi:hypothetical protein